MRVLFVTLGNKSHLYIAAPLAWAMRTAGHDVRVVARTDLAETVTATGLLGVGLGGLDDVGLTDRMNEAARTEDAAATTARRPRRPGSPLQEDYAWDDPHSELRANVTGLYPAVCPGPFFDELIAFARWWRPHLVVWDMLAYAGPVAARAVGAAHARLVLATDGVGQLRQRMADPATPDGPDALRDWLHPRLAALGEEFDEEIALGQWTVDLMPSWTYHPSGVSYLPTRHVSFNGAAMTPEWVNRTPDRPRVCITLGNSHRDAGRVEASAGALLEAVAGLDAEVVATLDPAQLSALPKLPGNTRVTGFVPLGALLPTCAAVVHHGGAGTFAAALEHGVPQLICPSTWWGEKWYGPVAMANGVEKEGAGAYVADSDRLTAELLHDRLARVLADPSYRDNARRLGQAEYATPAPNDTAAVLEDLTRQHWEANGGTM